MTNQEIAGRLIELANQGDFETIYAELFSPEIRSIEPDTLPDNESKGFDGLKEKGKKWKESLEAFHGQKIGEPIFADNYFALPWTTKVTHKGAPGPVEFSELCVYEVKDGKIVREQFFYTPQQ